MYEQFWYDMSRLATESRRSYGQQLWVHQTSRHRSCLLVLGSPLQLTCAGNNLGTSVDGRSDRDRQQRHNRRPTKPRAQADQPQKGFLVWSSSSGPLALAPQSGPTLRLSSVLRGYGTSEPLIRSGRGHPARDIFSPLRQFYNRDVLKGLVVEPPQHSMMLSNRLEDFSVSKHQSRCCPKSGREIGFM